MKNSRKLFTLLLSVILCVSLLPVSVSATSTVNVASGSCGSGVTWSLYYTDDSNENELTFENELTLLISGSGDMFGYMPQIGDTPPWFSYNARIKNIVVESGVTGIGMYAFFGCSSCKTVTLPVGLTSIFVFAFGECASLTSIEIPETVDTIGSSTFSGCRGLKAVTIPNSVTTFGNSVFENCTSLQSAKFLSDVAIPDSTFSGCYNLQTVESPTIVATPTASLATGNYTTEQTVSLTSSTSGADIYYTTDGTTPTQSSTKYSSPITVSESVVLKAIAVKSGNADSSVMTAYYILESPSSGVTVSTEQNMSIIHSVNPDYTVTIPTSANLGNSAEVSATDVKISKGKTLNVKISATSGENNAYTLVSAEGAEISYSIKNSGNDVAVGTPFLTVNAGNTSASTTLDFALVGEEIYAGNYTGTVTFTVSVY